MADTPTPKKAATKRKPTARKTPAKATAKVSTEPNPPVEEAPTGPPNPPVEEAPSGPSNPPVVAESKRRFVRNLSGAPFRMKLLRHASGERGIQLKPRGERGDIAPLEEGDLTDMILRDNHSLGLIEIITEGEATSTMMKQTTNQQAVHPALAALKNSQGEDGLTMSVGQSDAEVGVTVATLEDGQVVFERGKLGPEIRRPGESPGTPDNIPGGEPGRSPANEQPSFLSDLRSKTTVNPPQQG